MLTEDYITEVYCFIDEDCETLPTGLASGK